MTYQYNKRILLLLPAWLMLLAACSKNDNDTGRPGISRIRANLPSPDDSTLTKAGPGQWIVIEGTGFTTTNAVFFNGWPASFNATLFSDNSMVVLIPPDMPFATLDQANLNTIRIVTQYGEITYEFPIEPPPPVINSMSNEMALEGETVTLYGNNFFYVDKVVFPGGVEVTSGLTANDPGTTLSLVVPAGITTGGTISVVNRYGTGQSVLLFNDLTTGMLHNYDNVNNYEWGAGSSSSSTDFPGNRGTFALLAATSVSGGDMGWWNGSRSLNLFPSTTWLPASELGNPITDYAMKFEVSVRKPWSAGSIYIVKDYNWTFLARYEPWVGTGSYSGGWQTVTIPLTSFKTKANGLDGTGEAPPSLAALLGTGKGNTNIMFVNPGTSTVGEFEAAIDNIRIVRIN